MDASAVVEFFAHLRAKAEAEGHFVDSEVSGFLARAESEMLSLFDDDGDPPSATIHAPNPAETARD